MLTITLSMPAATARLIKLIVLLLALGGCGVTGSTQFTITPAADVGFQFEDQRPEDERLTARTTDTAGETIRLGDDSIKPSAPILFKTWLHDKFAESLTGKTVILRNFSVQITDPAVSINPQSFQAGVASTPGANPLSALLAHWVLEGIESARSDKTVSVRIAGTINNAAFTALVEDSVDGRVSEKITERCDNARWSSAWPISKDASEFSAWHIEQGIRPINIGRNL